jgi:hypothetical protein
MASARLATIPIDHLRAEIAAFPLGSEASLRLHPTALDPCLPTGLDPTAPLWRAAEHELLAAFPGFSVDEGVAWRDRLWFAEGSHAPVPLASYLRRIAGMFLRVVGPAAIPY